MPWVGRISALLRSSPPSKATKRRSCSISRHSSSLPRPNPGKAAAKDCGKIVTVEEHSIIGGLGEAVCSCLAEKCPVPVKRIGVNDEFGHSGPAADLLKQFGLSAEHITEVTEAFVK